MPQDALQMGPRKNISIRRASRRLDRKAFCAERFSTHMYVLPDNKVNANSIVSGSHLVVPLTVGIDSVTREALRPTNSKRSVWTAVTSEPIFMKIFGHSVHTGRTTKLIWHSDFGWQHDADCRVWDVVRLVNYLSASFNNGWSLIRQARLEHNSETRHWVDKCP